MKTSRFPLFRRILMFVFLLITGLSILFTVLTYLSAIHFEQASNQLLNKDVAAHIAKFTSPFETDSVNRQKADSVFYQAMVISPSIEVYFLDTLGKVLYYQGKPEEIKRDRVDLAPVASYLTNEGKQYITGPDPRDPENPKIFSAAPVPGPAGKVGYIYVILGSREYRYTLGLLFRSHAGALVLKTFLFILFAAIALSVWYVSRLRRHFTRLVAVLRKFEAGDFQARFPEIRNDDLAPVTTAFNRMANLLGYHIEALRQTEAERKDFTANISHDLRTPLSIARGYAETLVLNAEQLKMSPAETEEYLRLIISNLQQVENMVQQLLEISKLESASLVPAKQPFVISEIVQEMVHSTALSAAARNLRIESLNGEEPSWILADIQMMERVIQNLLSNAIKYTPEGGVVQIGFEKTEADLRLTITNDSEYFPAGLGAWLNDLQPAAKRPPTRGLGLVIVKTILQLHQFPMTVSADLAGRVVFAITLKTFQPPAIAG